MTPASEARTSPTPTFNLSGRVGGRFDLVDRLGSGRARDRYRAIDRLTGEPVSLQILWPGAGGGAASVAGRARSVADQAGPGLAPLVHHGTTSGDRAYLAFSQLGGERLADRLDRGPLTVAETIELGERIARALGALHAVDLVHANISPAEIALCPTRGPALVDVGGAPLDATCTAGDGEPWLAPEARGGAPDRRADVYALGAVMARCLGAAASVPEPLAALLERALAPEAAARPPDGAAVARALASIRADGEAAERPIASFDHHRDCLWLVAVGDAVYSELPLPASGSVDLGRGDAVDLRVDAASVSRRHARLHIGAGAIAIEDLGSANGTRVRNVALAPGERAAVKPGELVTLGDVSILLQRRAAERSGPRVWSRPTFMTRLAEECEVARRSGARFAVAIIAGADLDADALLAGLPGEAVVGRAGDRAASVMTTASSPLPAEAVAETLRAGLGAETAIGIARFPEDGINAAALVAAARRELEIASDDRAGPVVRSRSMRRLHGLLERVASGGDLSVLLLGETGVGKEILAEQVHVRSPRRDQRFVRINCGALTESLLESELFGHERGAFTGATSAKPGLLESACGGTVFLDEIGEMAMSTQVKLLRALEERAVRRVGGIDPRPIDVRFVAATNRDPAAEIAAGRFRKDLYYRLAGITLTIPPLRERADEIIPLAERFLGAAAGRLTAEARARLVRYAWPGNIRELRNVVERASLLAGDEAIGDEHLPDLEPSAPEAAASASDAPLAALYPGPDEKQRIIDALERCNGNQTRAAELLGISRRTMVNRLNRYQLPRPRKRR